METSARLDCFQLEQITLADLTIKYKLTAVIEYVGDDGARRISTGPATRRHEEKNLQENNTAGGCSLSRL